MSFPIHLEAREALRVRFDLAELVGWLSCSIPLWPRQRFTSLESTLPIPPTEKRPRLLSFPQGMSSASFVTKAEHAFKVFSPHTDFFHTPSHPYRPLLRSEIPLRAL